MTKFKTVGIKNLKKHLNAYLGDVKRGTRILVSDRNEVVAELREPKVIDATRNAPDPVLSAWERAGIVRLPSRSKAPLSRPPIRLPKGTAARLLDQNRRD